MPPSDSLQFSLLKTTALLFSFDIGMLLLHFLFAHRGPSGDFFNLNQEANLPTWYASFKLSLAALAAFLCYRIDQQKTHANSILAAWPWILVALLMLFMSMDETAQIHETLASWFMDSLAGARLRYAFQIQAVGSVLLWGILFAPVLILIAGVLLSFYINRFRHHKIILSMAVLSIFLFSCSFLLEQNQATLAGLMGSIDSSQLKQYQLMSVVEETCELFAINFLLLIHIAYINQQHS